VFEIHVEFTLSSRVLKRSVTTHSLGLATTAASFTYITFTKFIYTDVPWAGMRRKMPQKILQFRRACTESRCTET